MKLLFSEAQPDYPHYIFPYAVWAFPEPGETPADLFAHGFLPSSRELDRFYLCRQVRVNLGRFEPSSENRRILRKGNGLNVRLLPRAAYHYTPERRDFFLRYAEAKFGPGVMTRERLDALFGAPITSHLLVVEDGATGAELGLVTLYLEPGRMAYYYYAFYDLASAQPSLGMYLMTRAAVELAGQGFPLLYLGSCYSETALYKTQFTGIEFFNGVGWSDNLDELKYLVRRGQSAQSRHLLEESEYRDRYHGGPLRALAADSAFGTRHP